MKKTSGFILVIFCLVLSLDRPLMALDLEIVPVGIRTFLADVKEEKKEAAAGGSYVTAELGLPVLETLSALLSTYDFEVERFWLVADDCLLKLKAADEQSVVILTLRLLRASDNWRLVDKPLMREIRLPRKGAVRGDSGKLRRQANKLRAGILVDKAVLEGVEAFLEEMKGKHSQKDDG